MRSRDFKSYSSKKQLEIDPDNKIMQDLMKRVDTDEDEDELNDMVTLLYEAALLSSGFTLPQPRDHANRIFKMIKL